MLYIHGLVSLYKKEMNNEDFQTFGNGLTKSTVCDLFLASEIEIYVDGDSMNMRVIGLRHDCDKRCLDLITHKEDRLEYFVCCKPHSVFAKENIILDKFIPLCFK